MTTPEFRVYIAPARLYPEIWRLLLGLLLILFTYLGLSALMLAGMFLATEPTGVQPLLGMVSGASRPMPTLVLLLSFAGLGLGAVVAAAACHFRGPGTLFGPFDEMLRAFVIAAVISVLFLGVFTALAFALDPPHDNLPLDVWLRYLPFAVSAVLLQTASEELVFRAYLPQQLAARFSARAVWMGLPAMVFAVLHYDPEFGAVSWLIVATVFVFALIASDLVVQTGNLGAAMGLHFANNLFALLIVSMDGTITSLSLFVIPTPANAAEWAVALGINTLLLLFLWRVLRFVLTR